MTRTIVFIAALTTAFAAAATSVPEGYGNAVAGQGQEQGQDQGQHQAQGQTANGGHSGASAGASSGAAAVGGTGSSTINGGDTHALGLALPAPVTAARLPAATAACALSESSAWSVGWNFASRGTSKQKLDAICMAERQAAGLEAQCKFRTAAAIRYWVAREATAVQLPGVDHERMGGESGSAYAQGREQWDRSLGTFLADVGAHPWELERDLPAHQCTALRAAPAAATQAPVVVNVETTSAAQAIPAAVPAPVKAAPKAAKPVRKAAAPCPAGQRLVCEVVR